MYLLYGLELELGSESGSGLVSVPSLWGRVRTRVRVSVSVCTFSMG